MTKEEAVSWLRRYRRGVKLNPFTIRTPWYKADYIRERYVYERMLILELIERIKNSNKRPEEVIHGLYWDVDMFMLDSDNPRTHKFLRIIERCLGDILEELDAYKKRQCTYTTGEDLAESYLKGENENG